MSTARLGALSVIVFALAGIAWFALESTPPRLGFEDTDNPAVMVEFIRAHPEVFVQAGMALILMAVSLTIAVLSVAEVIGTRSGGGACGQTHPSASSPRRSSCSAAAFALGHRVPCSTWPVSGWSGARVPTWRCRSSARRS